MMPHPKNTNLNPFLTLTLNPQISIRRNKSERFDLIWFDQKANFTANNEQKTKSDSLSSHVWWRKQTTAHRRSMVRFIFSLTSSARPPLMTSVVIRPFSFLFLNSIVAPHGLIGFFLISLSFVFVYSVSVSHGWWLERKTKTTALLHEVFFGQWLSYPNCLVPISSSSSSSSYSVLFSSVWLLDFSSTYYAIISILMIILAKIFFNIKLSNLIP